MSKYKHFHPVSHDLNGDPEVWELTDRFGDRALRVWIEILSVADRNEGVFKGSSEYVKRTLSGRCHTTMRQVSAILEFAQNKLWVLPEWPLRVRNYADYHRTRGTNLSQNGRQLEPLLTNPSNPILPNLPKEKIEEDILSSSCAKPEVFARGEQSENGQQVGKQRKAVEISEQALTLATKLKDSILANYPDVRVPTEAQVKEWAIDLDKLNRLDGKTWEQIEWLLAWSQKDSFWSGNIQSGGKFRKQWNQLLARARAEQSKHPAPLTEEERARADDFMRLARETLEKQAKEKKRG